MKVENPILPGFHPDPCILRKDSDYYLVTSTFEWWPGVRLFHSRDLVNWELQGGILREPRLADLRGVPDPGGIWAPALSWRDGLFYLAYTVVKNFRHPYKDLANWLITAPSIEGPWSDPIYLNASGFDPSFFHDADGKSWLLNMVWHSYPEQHPFAGIVLQEYDREARKLRGQPCFIFKGSSLGRTEGPHLIYRQGWYYLITAEGGTGWEHAVTVCRSKQVEGPYEISPHHPLMTSWGSPEHPLQKAGHASLVETPQGDWFLVHLCSRPVGVHRRCILGRETAIQQVVWTSDGWPILAEGGKLPALACSIPSASPGTAVGYPLHFEDHFLGPVLDHQWSTLRQPPSKDWLSFLPEGGLRMAGRCSLGSQFDQSLAGIRVAALQMDYEVLLDFHPTDFQQTAGLGLYYNTSCHYFLAMGYEEGRGAVLRIIACDAQVVRFLPIDPIPISPDRVALKAELRREVLKFHYKGPHDSAWMPIGPALDATILSDDYPLEKGLDFAFTGTFAVLAVQDASGLDRTADFFCFSAHPPDLETG